MSREIPIRVAGIPALAVVHSAHPCRPGRYSGRPEDCYPSEGPEIEWDLCDRRGRPAKWLERKLCHGERERIDGELFAAMSASEYN